MTVITPPLPGNRNLAARADAFIAAARLRHGDRYDYGRVQFEFTNAHTRVHITCLEHGAFPQTPNDHRRGAGCPDCSGRRNSRTAARAAQFVVRARITHADRYDYSSMVFSDQKTPISIICPDHGSFDQRPTNHLAGRGCPDCADISRGEKVLAAASRQRVPRRGAGGQFVPRRPRLAS